MGVEFHPDRTTQLPLASKLRVECQEHLSKLAKFRQGGIPKHMLLEFLRSIVLPSVNYGAFVDEDEAENTYLEIDNDIASFLKELLSTAFTIEQMKDIARTSTKFSGLQMLLPGANFKLMNQVTKEV